MTSMQLALRYRVVPIISAVVMASAGLSLLCELPTWQETYQFVGGMYQPVARWPQRQSRWRYGAAGSRSNLPWRSPSGWRRRIC